MISKLLNGTAALKGVEMWLKEAIANQACINSEKIAMPVDAMQGLAACKAISP